MKQDSPLRKGDKHFDAINAYINKQTPTQIEAKRRETDEHVCADPWSSSCDEAENDPVPALAKPIREAVAAMVAGAGLGCAVLAVSSIIIGKPEAFGIWALGTVVCMLGYLFIDADKS